MKGSRRNHSSKFKARVALEALRGEAMPAERAQRHGVHASLISTRRKQLPEHAGEVFDDGTPALEDAERQIRDLRAKVEELTIGCDFFGRCARPIRPAEHKTLIDREGEVTIMRQCELLGLCRSSLY